MPSLGAGRRTESPAGGPFRPIGGPGVGVGGIAPSMPPAASARTVGMAGGRPARPGRRGATAVSEGPAAHNEMRGEEGEEEQRPGGDRRVPDPVAGERGEEDEEWEEGER